MPVDQNRTDQRLLASKRGAIQPLSLRQNFSWTLAGNLVYAGCQWGMIVVLTKLVSPEAVGQFALGLAITAPIFMFTNLQLRAVQATDAAGEFRFSDYLGLRLILTATAIVVVMGIAFLSAYSFDTSMVLVAVALAKAFEATSDVLYGLMQHRERMDRIAVSMMIKGLLSFAVLGSATYLSKSVTVGSIALAVSWAVVLLAYDVPTVSWLLRRSPRSPMESSTRWDPLAIRRLAITALPLGIVTMMASLNANAPRYLVERLLGAEDLAFYAAMAYVLVAGNTIVGAMAQSASPRMARLFASGERQALWRLVRRQIGICVLLGGIGVAAARFAGPWILTTLYRPEYAHYPEVFTILMVAAGFLYVGSVLGGAVTATRWYRGQAYIHLVLLVIVLFSNYLMISEFGLGGAAWALLCVSFFATLAYALVLAARLRTCGSARPGASLSGTV